MGFFDGKSLNSSGETPKKGDFFSSYNVPTSIIKKTLPSKRDEMIKAGLPVASKKRFEKTGKAEPSLGGEIVRGIAKPLTMLGLGVAAPFSKGMKATVQNPYQGKVMDPMQDIEVKAKDVADKVNRGEISRGKGALAVASHAAKLPIETASFIPLGGILGTVAKPGVINAFKTGALRSGIFGAGLDVANQLSSAEKYKPGQTALAFGVGTVADVALSKVFGKAAQKLPTDVTDVAPKIGSEIAQEVPTFIPQGSRIKIKEALLGLEKLGHDRGQAAQIMDNVGKLNDTGFYTIDEITEAATKSGIKPANKPTVIKPEKSTAIIKMKGAQKEVPTEQPVVKTEKPSKPITQEDVNNSYNDYSRNNPEDVFVSGEGKTKQWMAEANQDLERTKRIALGQEVDPSGRPSTLYHSVMSEIAEKEGNLGLIEDLSNSPVLNTKVAKSAQELRMRQISAKDNVVTVKNKIETGRFEQLSPRMKERYIQEINDLTAKLKKQAGAVVTTKEVVNNIINDLLC